SLWTALRTKFYDNIPIVAARRQEEAQKQFAAERENRRANNAKTIGRITIKGFDSLNWNTTDFSSRTDVDPNWYSELRCEGTCYEIWVNEDQKVFASNSRLMINNQIVDFSPAIEVTFAANGTVESMRNVGLPEVDPFFQAPAAAPQ